MKSVCISIGICCLFSSFVLAQSDADALRYTQRMNTGTARVAGLGGAYGAVGADMAAVTINPAGMGVYRKSEITLSPHIFNQNTKSNYYGSANTDNAFRLNLSNFGIVLTNQLGKDDDLQEWKSFSFGYTYNRINTFNERMLINGTTQNKSMIDAFVNSANGTSPENLDPFTTLQAFNTYLIDTSSIIGTNKYWGANYADIPIIQQNVIVRTGGMTESAFTFAGNYSNKLFVGGSLGFKRVNFTERNNYREELNDTALLQNFTYRTNLTTAGGGFYASIGAIYMPVNWFRCGLSLHSGTRLNLTDNFDSNMEAVFLSQKFNDNSPIGSFDYIIRIPGRITASAALISSKLGLITFDYETMNFQNMMLLPAADFSDVNSRIDNIYQVQHTIRVGAELKVKNGFSLRGGYANSTSPFTNVNNSFKFTQISGGVGYRAKYFYIDATLVQTQSAFNHFVYNPDFINPASINRNAVSIITTVGFRF